MMNGTVDQFELEQWMQPQAETVIEGEGPGTGPVDLFVLFHHANGHQTEIHAIRASSPTWKDWRATSGQVSQIAERHAKGVLGGGAQQYELVAVRRGKPAGSIPFLRVGSASIPGVGGGLATEPPTGSGLTSTAQRWGEIAIAGANAKDLALFAAQGQLIHELLNGHRALMTENREVMSLAKSVVIESLQKQADIMKEERKTLITREALKLSPLLLPALTGERLALPEAVEAAAFDDALLDLCDEQDLRRLIEKWGSKDPLRAAALVDHLARVQRRRAAETAEERAKRARNAREPTMEEALADIGGDEPSEKTNETNGATNGEAEIEIDAAIDRRHKHGVTRQQARQFVEGFASRLNAEVVPLKWAWAGDHLRFQAEGIAKGVAGVIDVDDVQLRIRVVLPGLARLAQSTIEEQIDAALATLDERAKKHAAATAANGGS